jgi:excisionase family DNA binding protein
MTRARTKPKKKTATTAAASNGPIGEVLTLTEAAAYLRLPESEVTRLVFDQGLPGRYVGSEWRFLKAALQDWLRTPPVRGSKEAFLSAAGIWKDMPDLADQVLAETSQRRDQPTTEDGE